MEVNKHTIQRDFYKRMKDFKKQNNENDKKIQPRHIDKSEKVKEMDER